MNLQKFKAVIATRSSVTLLPLDGSKVIILTGQNLLSQSDLVMMISNINKNGYTEIVQNESPEFTTKLSQWMKDNSIIGVDLAEVESHALIDIESGNPSLEKFIQRLKATSNSPELNQAIIEFVGRSGMALTVDGNIIGFRSNAMKDGVVVDAYTRTIPQLVHSVIHMDRDRVDASMSNSCSRGLHVASMDYVGSYQSNVCHAVLVKPENIVAVPYRERNKMRVCEYMVLQALELDQYKDIINKSMDSSETVLKQYIEGFIPAVLYRTHETDGSVIDVNVGPEKKKAAVKKVQVEISKPKEKAPKPTIDIKEVRMASNFKEMLRLFLEETTYANKRSRYNDLLIHKRKQKKSWASLGASAEDIKALKKMEK